MTNALNAGGYEGQYVFQTFGTSELGGKLLAEGTNLEADLVTMSTFYLQSAQEQNTMFVPLTFPVNTLEEVPDYTAAHHLPGGRHYCQYRGSEGK